MRTPKFLVKIGRFFRKNGPIMLSAVGVAGVVGTFALTIKANGDATERKEEAMKEKGEELTKWETIKAEAPAYILPGAVCVATSATIIINAIVNKKIQAGLVAAACTATDALKRARDKLTPEQKKELADESMHDNIDYIPKKKNTSDNQILYYDTFTEQYFWETPEQVRCAELNAANAMLYYGEVPFSDFLFWVGEDKVEGADKIGWSVGAGEAFYGYSYIQFEHEEVTLEDGTECIAISYPFPPHADWLDYDY